VNVLSIDADVADDADDVDDVGDADDADDADLAKTLLLTSNLDLENALDSSFDLDNGLESWLLLVSFLLYSDDLGATDSTATRTSHRDDWGLLTALQPGPRPRPRRRSQILAFARKFRSAHSPKLPQVTDDSGATDSTAARNSTSTSTSTAALNTGFCL
jgi:hypothetical protein